MLHIDTASVTHKYCILLMQASSCHQNSLAVHQAAVAPMSIVHMFLLTFTLKLSLGVIQIIFRQINFLSSNLFTFISIKTEAVTNANEFRLATRYSTIAGVMGQRTVFSNTKLLIVDNQQSSYTCASG